ncbi:Lrp/AsnC family transcriptional regulator [Castellaniella caeni]|nr:Lrp/AsnC ligand binding domain-containing protein [Castellaniella caeni]
MTSAPKLGFRIEAFVQLDIGQLNEAEHQYFAREIQAMDEVVNAFIITGQANYLLYVRTRDFEEFSQFIVNRLNKLRGVTRIHSQIVLDKLKSKGKFIPIGGRHDGPIGTEP